MYRQSVRMPQPRLNFYRDDFDVEFLSFASFS